MCDDPAVTYIKSRFRAVPCWPPCSISNGDILLAAHGKDHAGSLVVAGSAEELFDSFSGSFENLTKETVEDFEEKHKTVPVKDEALVSTLYSSFPGLMEVMGDDASSVKNLNISFDQVSCLLVSPLELKNVIVGAVAKPKLRRSLKGRHVVWVVNGVVLAKQIKFSWHEPKPVETPGDLQGKEEGWVIVEDGAVYHDPKAVVAFSCIRLVLDNAGKLEAPQEFSFVDHWWNQFEKQHEKDKIFRFISFREMEWCDNVAVEEAQGIAGLLDHLGGKVYKFEGNFTPERMKELGEIPEDSWDDEGVAIFGKRVKELKGQKREPGMHFWEGEKPEKDHYGFVPEKMIFLGVDKKLWKVVLWTEVDEEKEEAKYRAHAHCFTELSAKSSLLQLQKTNGKGVTAKDLEPVAGAHIWAYRGIVGKESVHVFYQHHGIYAGNGEVIHFFDTTLDAINNLLTHGDVGEVRKDSLEVFCGGDTVFQWPHEGFPMWYDEDKSNASKKSVERAKELFGFSGWRPLTQNCEHFANWAMGEESLSWQSCWELKEDPFDAYLEQKRKKEGKN